MKTIVALLITLASFNSFADSKPEAKKVVSEIDRCEIAKTQLISMLINAQEQVTKLQEENSGLVSKIAQMQIPKATKSNIDKQNEILRRNGLDPARFGGFTQEGTMIEKPVDHPIPSAPKPEAKKKK